MKRIIALVTAAVMIAALLASCKDDTPKTAGSTVLASVTAEPTIEPEPTAEPEPTTEPDPTTEPEPTTDPEPTVDHSAEDAALAAARLLFDAGEYDAAKTAYLAIGEYANAASMASLCDFKMSIKDVQVGDIVTFGRYEQDNVNNGKEPITWRVLKVEDGKALVISEYALYNAATNQGGYEPGIYIWEKSDLRAQLNGEFYSGSFTDEEKLCIALTHNTTAPNPDYGRDGGPDTDDYVFCLSYEEATELFADDADRVCYMTEYAQTNSGTWGMYNSAPIAHWWLRSPGSVGLCMMVVYPQGWIPTVGAPGDRYYFVDCRPALTLIID